MQIIPSGIQHSHIRAMDHLKYVDALFTGSIEVKVVTPSTVSLPTLQPVVLQIEADGEYGSIQWQISNNGSKIVDFDQTLVWLSQLECGMHKFKVDILNQSFSLSVNFTVIFCSKLNVKPPFIHVKQTVFTIQKGGCH